MLPSGQRSFTSESLCHQINSRLRYSCWQHSAYTMEQDTAEALALELPALVLQVGTDCLNPYAIAAANCGEPLASHHPCATSWTCRYVPALQAGQRRSKAPSTPLRRGLTPYDHIALAARNASLAPTSFPPSPPRLLRRTCPEGMSPSAVWCAGSGAACLPEPCATSRCRCVHPRRAAGAGAPEGRTAHRCPCAPIDPTTRYPHSVSAIRYQLNRHTVTGNPRSAHPVDTSPPRSGPLCDPHRPACHRQRPRPHPQPSPPGTPPPSAAVVPTPHTATPRQHHVHTCPMVIFPCPTFPTPTRWTQAPLPPCASPPPPPPASPQPPPPPCFCPTPRSPHATCTTAPAPRWRGWRSPAPPRSEWRPSPPSDTVATTTNNNTMTITPNHNRNRKRNSMSYLAGVDQRRAQRMTRPAPTGHQGSLPTACPLPAPPPPPP